VLLKKIMKWMLVFFLSFSIAQFSITVNADHHKDEKKSKNEQKKKYWYQEDDDEDDDFDEDDDEDDDEKYEYYENQKEEETYQENGPSSAASFWNVWAREATTFSNTALPFLDAREVGFKLSEMDENFFIVPQNGQLLVSAEKAAKFLGAKVEFFSQSKILVVSKGHTELIIRAGSNAAYENRKKTPMPTQALFYENSLYIPISVIANAMNYRVSWNEATETILLQQIN